MSRKHHYLKCETVYFQGIERGWKKFELRYNDRNYEIGDMVHLQETVNGTKTGREMPPVEIRYVLKDREGLSQDYCIFCW